MNRGGQRTTVHGVTESDMTEQLHIHFTVPLLIPVITILMLLMVAPCVAFLNGNNISELMLLLLLLSCFSPVRLCTTPETAAHQAPLSLGFSRQEHWSTLSYCKCHTNRP